MGVMPSNCIIDPSTQTHECLAPEVIFKNPTQELFQTYLVSAAPNAATLKITYNFECLVKEEKYQGSVECNSTNNQVVVKCGNDSHEISLTSVGLLSFITRSRCSLTFDFHKEGLQLFAYNNPKKSLFFTNKFTATPATIKTDQSSNITWSLEDRNKYGKFKNPQIGTNNEPCSRIEWLIQFELKFK
ncbi:cysteine rich protein [Cryptosporidium felis]|nr:cysteine rich protein [Cryptosporidium felis]